MVSAKFCLALVVGALVVVGMADARGHSKADKPREELERAEHAEHLRSRLETIARIAEAIMLEDDPNTKRFDMNSCFGGYMAVKCNNNDDERSARNGH